jgi:pilus assembly protein CpaE
VPLLFVLALWQVGLIGYTYVLAGHAAQEGARMMAVNPTDGKPDDAAYKKIRTRAMGEVPKPWRGGARVDVPDDESTVAVRLKVPVVLPGLKSPFTIGSRAATAIEDEELPPSQAITPEPVS